MRTDHKDQKVEEPLAADVEWLNIINSRTYTQEEWEKIKQLLQIALDNCFNEFCD